MQDDSRKKITSIVIVIILILSIYFTASFFINWFPFNDDGKFYPNPLENCTLDYSFIRNMTESLSNVIFEAYDEENGEIAKGRAFGTKGEWEAANKIKDNMSKLGLYNPGLDPPYLERIENIPYPYKMIFYDNLGLTDKLEVLSKRLTINDKENNNTFDVECFISPTWNNTGPFDNRNVLTRNFSYSGVKIITRNETDFDGFLDYAYNELSINKFFEIEYWSLCGSVSLENFTEQLLEEYYDFTIERIDPDNKSTWPSFVDQTEINDDKEFVLLEVNKGFNPDYNDPDENNRSLHPIWIMFRKWFEKQVDVTFDTCYHDSIVGKISYDYDPHCHDSKPNIGRDMPVIYINGADGGKINNISNTCTVDFYVNQSFNTSVISYNVIGQINGTDQSKTVIISSLYDSMWCQGTADSAIGMSIVLGIAKYFKDYDVTPKYNVKFIAFGGEEYGMIGAKYYEAAHKNESIWLVVDINQVGFHQLDPRLTLHIITNKLKEMDNISEIIGRSNYENRTPDGSTIDIDLCPVGSRSNDLAFASALPRRSNCRTVMFVKDFGWTLHHRDGRKDGTGEPHTAGDVMKYYNETEVALTAGMVLNVTYGLLFKEIIWNWPGFIPLFIALILISIAVILIWKKEYFMDILRRRSKHLSRKEKDEFSNLIVSYKVFIDILFRNRFLTLIYIIFIGGFFFFLLPISFGKFGSLLHSIDPVRGVFSVVLLLIVSLIASITFLSIIFSFSVLSGLKRYFVLWSKDFKKLVFYFTVLIIFIQMIIFFLGLISSIYPDYLLLVSLLYYVSYFLIIILLLLFPVYFDAYRYRNAFFSYARMHIEKYESHIEKIKAFSSLLLIHSIYLRKFETLFGKKALSSLKLNSIIILALKIMKLDTENKKEKTILDLLSKLQKIDPLTSTQKFINTMETIEKKYGKEFLHMSYDELAKRERYFNVTLAKISAILAVISVIVGIFISLYDFIQT